LYPWFQRDPRNLKVGISLDGMSPFSQRASTWTMWPVFLVNYNIPPWMALKAENILLSMILPGRRQVKDINVYLEPLVDELKLLWAGIEVEDVTKLPGRQIFSFHAMVLWTMQDFPGMACTGNVVLGHVAYLFNTRIAHDIEWKFPLLYLEVMTCKFLYKNHLYHLVVSEI
jgi:hypothetical protein